jgi:membrane-associated protease RseP (regulator of RpoE activity)
MNIPIGLGAVVAFLVIAELGRVVVARLFSYPPERHAIPIMKLPGARGTTGFRLALILAGPVTVYLAVAALAFAFFRCHGTAAPERATTIEQVIEGSGASGKLEPGDVILEVDGTAFSGGSTALTAQVAAKAGAPVAITVDRGGAKQSVTVTPTQRDGRWLLGVQLAAKRQYSTVESLEDGFWYPTKQAAQTGQGLLEIFRGTDEVDAGGPVRIVSEFRSGTELTTSNLVLLMGMIFGTWTLIALALFDLVRALFLILFRS